MKNNFVQNLEVNVINRERMPGRQTNKKETKLCLPWMVLKKNDDATGAKNNCTMTSIH